jgi:ABC-type transport system involved in multi-copper enzyme maturation permease subunit
VSLVRSCAIRVRRTFSLSNGLQAWRERLGFGLVAGSACALYALADQLTLGQQTLLGGLLVLTLAILLRQRWFTLVGPVLLHDLVRTARRSRFTLYRIYAYFVLILLGIFVSVWYSQTHLGVAFRTRDSAAFAQDFFYSFLMIQILAVAVLTPAYLAGIITEEKERSTLEYLLATDLRNREIVFGKLGARLANLMLMLLTGLPVVSSLELMGGVEPAMVLAGFGVAAATAVGLGGLSALASVYARRTRSALVLTYLTMVVYLILSTASLALYRTGAAAWVLNLGPVSISGGNLLDGFIAGNPIVQLFNLAVDVARGGRVSDTLAYRFRDYALFHSLVGGICTAWAVIRLRAVFYLQADNTPSRGTRRIRWLFRPQLGNQPMMWKEVFVEGGLRLGRFGRLLLVVLVASSFFSLYIFSNAPGITWDTPAVMSFWSAAVGCAVACLLLLGVAVRAANSLSGERDRQTLDGLLATPLDPTTILFAKWLGSLASVRWGWLWLGAIWAIGYLYGVWHVLVVPLLIVAMCVYAAFLATVGLWFSLVSRTSLRATAYTMGSALVMGFIFLAPLYNLFPNDAASQMRAWRLYQFQLGLSPPAALSYLLPISRADLDSPLRDPWYFQAALWGLVIWALATAVLWYRTSVRFRKLTGRRAVRPPMPAGEPKGTSPSTL